MVKLPLVSKLPPVMAPAASVVLKVTLSEPFRSTTPPTPLMPSGACETSSTDGSRIDEKKLSRIASVSLSIAFAGTCAQVRKIIAAVFGANSSSIALA